MAKNSEARIRANNKYSAKAYDDIKIRVKKGERERFKSYLQKREKSLNGFVVSCISYCIDKDIDLNDVKSLGEVLSDKEE